MLLYCVFCTSDNKPIWIWICHLELMRQRVGWKSTIESALGELAESHASAALAGLEAVVTNSVFWDEWITRIPASIGSIRVLQTWGVHPKAVKNVNWCWMEEKLAAAECVAVGECGLDETAEDMELQEKVFKRQILIAHQLKKPLVLHLRGKTSRTTSALCGRALALTTACYTNATRCICTASAQDKQSFNCGIVRSRSCWLVVPGSLPASSAVKRCWDQCLRLSWSWKRIAPTWLREAGSWTAPTGSMSRLSP